MSDVSHILVVFERSRAGRRAVELAAALADEHEAEITVALVVAYERRTYGCCLRSGQWNQLLDEIALEEVAAVREMLGDREPPVRLEIVAGEGSDGLAALVERLGCDLVLAPKPWLGPGRMARQLRGRTHAEIQAVAAS